jgi:hypothetical protein
VSLRPVTRVRKSRKCTRWIIVKCGSFEIPAYRYSNGKGCSVYYEAGRRVRRAFTDERTAKAEAGLIAARLATGDHRALQLSPFERDSFVIAQSHIRPFDLPLHFAAEEYAYARRALTAGVSLAQAVDAYVRSHAVACVSKTVAEAVEEFVEAKFQDGISIRYSLRTAAA